MHWGTGKCLQSVPVADYLSHDFVFLYLDKIFLHCLDKPPQEVVSSSCTYLSLSVAGVQTAPFTHQKWFPFLKSFTDFTKLRETLCHSPRSWLFNPVAGKRGKNSFPPGLAQDISILFSQDFQICVGYKHKRHSEGEHQLERGSREPGRKMWRWIKRSKSH